MQAGNVAAGKGKASFFQREQTAAVAHDQIELAGHVIHARSRHRDIARCILHIAQSIALAGAQDGSRQVIGSCLCFPHTGIGGKIDRSRDLRHVVRDIVQTHLEIMVAGIQFADDEFRASECLAFIHTVARVETHHEFCCIIFRQTVRKRKRQITDTAAVRNQAGKQPRCLILDNFWRYLPVVWVSFDINLVEFEVAQERNVHRFEMRCENYSLLQRQF